MRISDWSSDVCSSDLKLLGRLYRALRASQLPAKTKERPAGQVERFQSDILDRPRMLERMESGAGRDVGTTAHRLLKVIDLCGAGGFLVGRKPACARTAATHRQTRRGGGRGKG